MQVGDSYNVKIFFFQIGQHLREIWELFRIDRERPVVYLKINIQIKSVGGNSL